VVGRLDKRKWEDREGNMREAVEVRVDRLELLGDRKERAREHDNDDDLDEQPKKRKASAGAKRGSEISDDLDDNIPF
jgi:single-stranded DNA-binding protein